MSLNRVALRLAVIEALLADPVLDRLVEGRVFDSRISALDHREPVPVILVTTESGRQESQARQSGGGPFWETVTLVLEVAMNAVLGEGDGAMIATSATDAALEARLDLIEDVAVRALYEGATPEGRLLREAVTRVDPKHVETDRFATDQTGERLASHIVRVTCELKTDRGDDDPFAPPTGPFALLPEPLRTVAAALPEGAGRDTCLALVADLAPPTGTPPPAPDPVFTGLDTVLAPQDLRGPAAPDRADDTGAGRVIRAAATIPQA